MIESHTLFPIYTHDCIPYDNGGGVVCLPSTLKTHLNNHDTNWELVGINLDGEGESVRIGLSADR